MGAPVALKCLGFRDAVAQAAAASWQDQLRTGEANRDRVPLRTTWGHPVALIVLP
jgi:hypothetical protein